MKRKKLASMSAAAVLFLFMPVPAYTGAADMFPAISVKTDIAEIDTSNAKDGYVMVRYLGVAVKELRVIIDDPGGTQYIYRLRSDGKFDIFPLSGGDGYYRVTVYENVFENKYSTAASAALNIRLYDEFAPFLNPNQYVNYKSDGKTAKKAAELTESLTLAPDKISAIFHYVITGISYDQQLADTIQAGYLPDVDKVLETGKGICFDYAAVTAAMLRSQGIPAKLVIGYRDDAYHAWVSAYYGEAGWKLLDPTYASYANSGLVKYTKDKVRYLAKYFY